VRAREMNSWYIVSFFIHGINVKQLSILQGTVSERKISHI
jgi:hypothetical protein